MGDNPSSHAAKLDVYIYDYLMRHNMVATAKAFMKETQMMSFLPDLGSIDVPGELSGWWSIFWEQFVAVKDSLEHPDFYDYRMHQSNVNSPQICSQVSHLTGTGRSTLPNLSVHSGFLGQGPVDMTAPNHTPQPHQQSAKNLLLVPSSDQDEIKMNLELFVSGTDKSISGVFSEAPDLEDGEGTAAMPDLPGNFTVQKTMGSIFEEVLDLKASSKKIFCCDFSSDGEFLASAGDENKVFIWNLRKNVEKHTWEAHSSFIRDISFRPNDIVLATASSDKTVRLWDAFQSDYPFETFVGHYSQVRSVDFHPTNPSTLCSSDDSGRIFLWTIGQRKPQISKHAGMGKVRFHSTGNCLASSVGYMVDIIQVEVDKKILCLQVSNDLKCIQSLCWGECGDYLATLSEDCVRVWSQRGEPVQELTGKMRYFHSCSFHPTYPNTLVIGGYQTITLWNFGEKKEMSVQPRPHSCYVSDLAKSSATGMVASASHDGCVKIWK